MVLTYNNRLIQNIIDKKFKNIKSALHISKNERVYFPSVDYVKYHEFTGTHDKIDILPYDRGQFDFVYCRNPLSIFKNFESMYAELLRTCKSGIIQNVSPMGLYLHNNKNNQYIQWTNYYSNSLCLMPIYNYNFPELDKKEQWQSLCLHKPFLLSDWYIWTSMNEFNICMYNHQNYEDYIDYNILFEESINESFKNTSLVIKN